MSHFWTFSRSNRYTYTAPGNCDEGEIRPAGFRRYRLRNGEGE